MLATFGRWGEARRQQPHKILDHAGAMRKRQRHNNRATKATQRIDYSLPDDAKPKPRPKGRSIGGPWIRKRK